MPGQPLKQQPAQRQAGGRLKVTFASSVSPSREVTPRPRRPSLAQEQEKMAAELVDDVRERQRELDCLEEAMAGGAIKAEAPGGGVDARRRLLKEMAGQSKRRLELKNAIARDMGDLEKLMDLMPED